MSLSTRPNLSIRGHRSWDRRLKRVSFSSPLPSAQLALCGGLSPDSFLFHWIDSAGRFLVCDLLLMLRSIWLLSASSTWPNEDEEHVRGRGVPSAESRWEILRSRVRLSPSGELLKDSCSSL